MESIISGILTVIFVYWLIGAIFSIIFLLSGLSRVDASTEKSGWIFKLLIFPGMTIFWPLFLRKWLKR